MANAPSRPRPINGAGAPWCPHPKTDGQGTANAGIAMKQSHVANVNIFICTTLEARFAVSEARLYEFRMPSSGPYGLTLTAYRSPLARLRARRRLAGRYGRHGAGSDRSRPAGSDRFWGLFRSDRIERAFALFVGATRHQPFRRVHREVGQDAVGAGASSQPRSVAARIIEYSTPRFDCGAANERPKSAHLPPYRGSRRRSLHLILLRHNAG
jgi:hypothetical protein